VLLPLAGEFAQLLLGVALLVGLALLSGALALASFATPPHHHSTVE